MSQKNENELFWSFSLFYDNKMKNRKCFQENLCAICLDRHDFSLLYRINSEIARSVQAYYPIHKCAIIKHQGYTKQNQNWIDNFV